ncbi:hypothetical protein AMS68_005536 [Peltaster fructicola]|uniref:Uncharacterized protein n=1 Tax=Peltaster fructicola TaxID=286661 RepID=A0A6H0XZH6_9PEZI|nr:hypothetical protein AMS68_005536 [Peltaster fructicola]
MALPGSRLSYAERLQTFKDSYWENDLATARQLAAIGHVSDRPPLESLEEGSRCINCAVFKAKDASVTLLDNPITDHKFMEAEMTDFHHKKCIRLATRMPRKRLRSERWPLGRSPSPPSQPKRKPQCSKRAHGDDSSFMKLPVEIRLQIYGYILPRLGRRCHIQEDPYSSATFQLMAVPAVGPVSPGELDILRTCRTIHAEALSELYSKTELAFSSTKLLYIFLRTVGRRGRRFLQAVAIKYGSREDALAFALLACCESLATFRIMVARPTLMYPGAPFWIIDGIATMLDNSGIERVHFVRDVQSQAIRKSSLGLEDYSSTDTQVIRRELTRPRDSPSNVRFIDGIPDL